MRHDAGARRPHRFAGTDLAGMRPHRIARLGIGLVPEGRRCFPNLTVQENLVASARPGEWTLDAVKALFPRLGERRVNMPTRCRAANNRCWPSAAR